MGLILGNGRDVFGRHWMTLADMPQFLRSCWAYVLDGLSDRLEQKAEKAGHEEHEGEDVLVASFGYSSI